MPESSPPERQLTAAHEQLVAAEANDVKAQDDLRHRYKLLVDKREVSQQIYDQALAAAKSSTATVAAARANESAAQQFVQQARSRCRRPRQTTNTRRPGRSRFRRPRLACGRRSPMWSKSARLSSRRN
jgi:plasmid stabilization system protein ParE